MYETVGILLTWCLRKILRVPYTRHVTNASDRNSTECAPLSDLVRYMRYYLARASARKITTIRHHTIRYNTGDEMASLI